MSRDSPLHRQQMRSRIAHLAAKMIAQDGVTDYSLAKRKAARQAGAPDSRNLPTNEEIEEAVRVYQDLYQADEHPDRLHRLRVLALDTMHLLADFAPHLTGAVLAGNAGRHADIHLQVYTDNFKELEIYLHNQRVDFRTREVRVWVGEANLLVPDLMVSTDEAEIHITVLPSRHLRQPVRLSADGRVLERASAQAVRAMVQTAD